MIMANVRYGWIGESRRTALRSLVAGEVGDWSRAWWIMHASAEVDVQASGRHVRSQREPSPLVCRQGAGSLALFLGGMGVEGIGKYLLGTDAQDGSGWSQKIGQEALDDLVARLLRRAGLSGIPALIKTQPTEGLTRARLGAYVMTLSLGRLQFDLSLDRDMVDLLVAPSACASIELTPRDLALGQARVRVKASLDFGATSVANIADLRVGEVLVGDCELDQPIAIGIENGGAAAMGSLRRIAGRRAVVLEEIGKQE
jgi:hypothetical protein